MQNAANDSISGASTKQKMLAMVLMAVAVLFCYALPARADAVSDTSRIKILEPVSWSGSNTATVIRPIRRLSWGIELEPLVFWARQGGIRQVSETLGATDLPGTALAGGSVRLFFAPLAQLRFGLFVSAAKAQSAPYSTDGFERKLSVNDTFGGVFAAWHKSFGKFYLHPSLDIGIGGWQYSLEQSDTLEGAPGWDDALQIFRARYTTATFTRRLTAGYLGVQPQMRLGWQISDWFALQAYGGWRVVYVPAGTIAASTWNSVLKDSPVINLSGPVAGIGIVVSDHFVVN